MNLPNKIEPIKPNYHEDDAISLLERWFDEWIKEEDWWCGAKTWDLNIFTEHDEKEYDYGRRWIVNIYGLVRYDGDEYLSTDTSNELDLFELKL